MRNLSVAALAKIATKLGNEPITILEVDWVQDVPGSWYADRDVGSIPGRILEVGDLDNVIGVSENNSSQEISIVLDDTDGTLKAIIDSHDIHKRSARVYQWFAGLDFDDKFLVFSGKISSPINWSERDRSVSFTVVSQLEDLEVGFSAEEGDFDWIPKDLIGKAWPMIFGTVQDSPCLQFNHAVTGVTQCGIGIISGQEAHLNHPLGGNDLEFRARIGCMLFQANHLGRVAYGLDGCREHGQADQMREQADDVREQISSMYYERDKAERCAIAARQIALDRAISEVDGNGLGCNPVLIIGGEDFPQDVGLKLNIGSGVFTGYFEGAYFHITDRVHEVGEATASTIDEDAREMPDECKKQVYTGCGTIFTEMPCNCPGECATSWSDYGPVVVSISFGSLITVENPTSEPPQILQHHWIEAGTQVDIYGEEAIKYVVSIIPGTVFAVKAYKQFKSARQLVNVPDDLYEVETVNYGPVTAVQIVITKLLSTIPDQGWEDDLYVTFTSTVGPHTCDILQYIIENYTDLEYDSTSFTAIRTKLDPFPMNFPILDRKNTLNILQEIAFQARCALWLSNGTFYIKYLPDEPNSDNIITDSDIDAEAGINIELTSTEDLVTKMLVNWRMSWAEDEEQMIILRHNVKKYGTQAEEFDFFCFNQPDIVLKAATFWLIRKSNTWKRVSFKSYLNKLNLETFDTITLDFSGNHVSTGTIKAIVEEATYNSVDHTIDFVCLTPVKSGTMEEYQFFWPSAVSPTEKFPTDWERVQGYAGGDGIGAGATGQLPVGFLDPDDWGDGIIWVGGPNVVFSGHADWGDPTPTDVDFSAQPVVISENFAELSIGNEPVLNLTTNYMDDTDLTPIGPNPRFTLLDLRKTMIWDSEEDAAAPLISFFKKVEGGAVPSNNRLVVDGDGARWFTEEGTGEGELFDFRFDEDGGKYGAGTAFLKAD